MKKITLLLLAMTVLWSCGKYDLYYPAPAPGTTQVRFVPNKQVYNLFKKATVHIYEGNSPLDSRTDLLDSLIFNIPSGKYNILTMSSGDNIQFRNVEHFDKAEAFIEPLTPGKTNGTHYVPNTDSLYHYVVKDCKISDDGTKLDVPLAMETRSKRLYMELVLEKDATNIEATISGVAISLNLSTGKPNYEPTRYLTALLTKETNNNKALLTCTYFGVMPPPENITPETPKHSNELDIIIEYNDGSKEETGTDITDIFDNLDPDKPNDITVTIQKIQGAFQVVGWRYGTGWGHVTGL